MSRRTERISTLLQEEISGIVQKELRDPRLQQVLTISRVEISTDLQHAKVSVSTLGGPTQEREALAGLRSAAGFLRRELGQRLRLRHMPDLQFVPDVATKEGDHVLGLLDSIRTNGPPSSEETKQDDA